MLDADVRGLAPEFTYKWVISDGDALQRFERVNDMPSIRVQVLVGTGAADRLTPDPSHDYLRLVTRLGFTRPLDGSFVRPLLLVNGQDPGLGWVVAAPNEVVRLLRQPCA
jgi:hypothetical protein